MLEKRLSHSFLGRVVSSAALAGIMHISTPVYAEKAPDAALCEAMVESAVQIGDTDYCTDRFGVIYDESGGRVRNAKLLLQLRTAKTYTEAQESADALYQQLEAKRQREASERESSPLENAVDEQRAAPPPYRPAQEREYGSSPAYQPSGSSHPSYSNIKEERKSKWGTWCGVFALAAVAGGISMGVAMHDEDEMGVGVTGAITAVSGMGMIITCMNYLAE